MALPSGLEKVMKFENLEEILKAGFHEIIPNFFKIASRIVFWANNKSANDALFGLVRTRAFFA